MGNTYTSTTKVWVVDSTGTLETGIVFVTKIIFIPGAADDFFELDDNADNMAIYLKAGASDASPIHVDFGAYGRKLPSLKVKTITAGTAYVFLRSL